jgi:hypothetical protein
VGKYHWSNGEKLTHEYTFVAHHVFDHYLEQLLTSNPGLKKSFEKQIDLIKTNPYIGSPMKYAPSDIAGRVYKKKMGGSSGYSICYIIFREMKVVLGVYITPEARKDIDYREFPWDILVQAVKDFNPKNLDKFRIV